MPRHAPLVRALSVLLPLLLTLILAEIDPTTASRGDRQPDYHACVESCVAVAAAWSIKAPHECAQGVAPAKTYGVWAWPCRDECRYGCMRKIEAQRAARGEEPLQYHGKWPFFRYARVQEPLSTLFSLLNALPNVPHLGWSSFRDAHAHDDATTRLTLYVSGVAAFTAWASSFVYHSKETWLTERLDYHWAAAHICMTLQVAVVRLLRDAGFDVRWSWLVAVAQLAGLARHIWYMNTASFDYGWNTVVLGSIVAAQAIVWTAWYVVVAWLRPTKSPSGGATRATHAGMVLRFQLLLAFATSLELLDFPPLGNALDAHAAWHAATIPLSLYWYRFLRFDRAWRAATAPALSPTSPVVGSMKKET